MYKAVFSDIDGTLLNDAHQVTPATRDAVLDLGRRGIPFILVSARCPGAIEPIRKKNGFSGPMICFSGALILDENGKSIHSQGMSLAQAREIIEFTEGRRFDMAWCLYSARDWLVRDRSNPKVAMEEEIVELHARDLPPGVWPKEDVYYKILCICDPASSPEIEAQMKIRFPRISIVRSSQMMLEIMVGGVSKGFAVRKMCEHLGIGTRDAVALGDNYNDLDMLAAVGRPVVMKNAPEEIRRRFDFVTDDNEHDGVAKALARLL